MKVEMKTQPRVQYIMPRQENKIASHYRDAQIVQEISRAINAWLYRSES